MLGIKARSDALEALRESTMFLLAMLVLWPVAQYMIIGGYFGFAVLYGVIFGFWAVVTIGGIDWASRQWQRGLAARLLFLALVSVALLLLWLAAAYGPGHPSNKRFLYSWTHGLSAIGAPLLIVIVCYLLRPHPRSPASVEPQPTVAEGD